MPFCAEASAFWRRFQRKSAQLSPTTTVTKATPTAITVELAAAASSLALGAGAALGEDGFAVGIAVGWLANETTLIVLAVALRLPHPAPQLLASCVVSVPVLTAVLSAKPMFVARVEASGDPVALRLWTTWKETSAEPAKARWAGSNAVGRG